MEDAVVSALVSDVLSSITSTAIQEFGRLWRLEADVSALRNTYTQIQDVLNDAEVKQKEQKDVESWLKSLRSASLEVENILDLFVTEAMLQRLHNERGIKYNVRAFFSSNSNLLMVRARIAHKVKTIRRKLDDIAENKSKFNLNSNAISVDAGVGGEITKMETTSLVGTSEVYGRDAEMEMVVDKICSKDIVRAVSWFNPRRFLSWMARLWPSFSVVGDRPLPLHKDIVIDDIEGVWVYAIWGMGGVGKTTLAQLVYNHDRVRAHFDLRSWVYVSNEFEVKKLTREIIESIDESQCKLPQLDAMQKHLQDKLKGKRFFIVLDDVWIDDRDTTKWEELRKALGSGAKGSIVMVTTRNETTSKMMAKVPEFQHKLGCLSKEDSWSLFNKLAFAPGREGEDITKLVSIGKEIVDKCKGLPLAVKTLGGLMWSKKSVIQWQSVKDSDVWELQENNILPALKLSYDNLLPHLKRCFSYCCLFPKGYEMRKDILIELWISNGFIPRRGETDLYVIAEEIFSCLVSRSFFQDVQVDKNSTTMDLVCKMHDLMHDLAQDVRRHDSSIIKPGKELITSDELLHLSSSCSEFSFLDQDLKRLRSLRSIFIFGDDYNGSISQIFQHVYLRVLRLDGFRQSTLPESICELKHLRYLSLSNSSIRFLPESIIYLQNLQVLVVRGCRFLYKLPEGMRYMKNLRCLDNRDCYELDCMPVGLKELTCLRRLARFVVGKKKGARIGELGDLNLLGCGLELVRLENVGGLEDAKSANLKYKGNLTYLALCWSDSSTLENEEEMLEEVLEGLEPNSSLEKLDILNYMGKIISPSWMINLGNLVTITFWHCSRCESIPSLGKLPSLRVMNVVMMNGLKCFHDDEFPSLHELNIVKCPSLVSLPSNLPKLIRLSITLCPELQSLPDGLLELTFLRIMGCKNLIEMPEKNRGEDWWSNIGEDWWSILPRIPYLSVLDGGIRCLAIIAEMRLYVLLKDTEYSIRHKGPLGRATAKAKARLKIRSFIP